MTARRIAPLAPFILLAYLPALLSSPGRMPADSKLYLYLDPGGFFADAAGSFDPGQFAGWVPHQHIAHLWPTLPWFWTFEVVGVPDWVAHRLWIGTLFVAAGLGVRSSARLLGLTARGAIVAGLVYQVSPYVLPYVSRTSVMLLPWAGLGWILALTIVATRRRTWADAAAVALVVATVGAVNATALVLVVPVPVIWLVHAAIGGDLTPRAAVVVAARIGVLCVGVSAWWIAALLIQGRYGAELLPYSEALADVSAASTSTEVWRTLGYWLFYVRDAYAPTTTAASPYLTSSVAIAASFAVPVVCLVGLVGVRWMHRRFAALLVAVGGVLAVGVHPIDDRSPIVALLSGGGDDGLVLALRSSTRAVPVMALGTALAAGALVAGIRVPVRRRLASWGIVGLAVANMPALWTAALVDPAIDRDQDPPAAWRAAAASLDDPSSRVLVLPGAEFGAYRWGYTVDQPLPGLTDVPVVTRDLLPLGSPAAMDLLYAFDDRFHDGVAEPSSFATIARLLGVGTVWLANDLAFDRFRTVRPELVRDLVTSADGFTDPVAFGTPTVNRPDVAMVDETSLVDHRVGTPLPPVELVGTEPARAVDRIGRRTVLVAGSGDGLVDAAAAGLLADDTVVRYTADGATLDPSVVGLIVTDSNRDRARHWRGSQDTTGYTEPGGPGVELLREQPGDARLEVFSDTDPSTRTTALQMGPVTATATTYGEPFALTPEHRPVMAIDGDPATAWLVGEHADPVGETLRLTIDGGRPVDAIRLLQRPTVGRRIRTVEITTTDTTTGRTDRRQIDLDERSWSGTGQSVPVHRSGDGTEVGTVDITILGAPGGGTGAVGFAEVDLGLGPTLEVVRPPSRPAVGDVPIARVFTRLRVDPLDRWRADPEPSLVRMWTDEVPRTMAPSYTVRIDARRPDAELADLFGWPVVADRRLSGSLRSVGASAFDGDPSTSWTSPFDDPTGRIDVRGVDGTIDEVRITQPTSGHSTVVEIVLVSGDGDRRIRLEPDADGVATADVSPPLVTDAVSIVVTDVVAATTVDRRFGDLVTLPVAISEIEFDGAPSLVPVADASLIVECLVVAHVDDVALRATISTGDTEWIDGAPLDAEPCDDRLSLGAGDHLLRGADGAVVVDRVVLDDGFVASLAASAGRSTGGVEVIERGRFGGRFRVDCPSGCWFVFGEGFNDGWSAEADGRSLGPPALVDGGFNGWWIDPGGTDVLVDWRPQRLQSAASALSGLVMIGALVLVGSARRRRRGAPGDEVLAPRSERPCLVVDRAPFHGPGWVVVIAWAMPAALVAGPGWGLVAGLGGVVAQRWRTVPLAALGTVATVATIGLGVVALEFRRAPAHDLGWPAVFETLHGFGMLAFALLVTSAIVDSDAGSPVVSRVEVGGTPVEEGAAAR